MAFHQLLEPDFLVDEGGTPADGPVLIADDRIVATGATAVGRAPRDVVRLPLPGKMLSLGFHNTHSHAVQRALRGRVETKSKDRPDDSFWSWREQMYADANRFSLADIEAIAAWCFADMLRSGFVAVGEFHYLHHAPDGTAWNEGATAAAQAIARAAARVGIRLVLLTCAYERAGPGAGPTEGQRRFVFPAVDAFLNFAAEVEDRVTVGRVHHGLAIHSVRACSAPWISAIGKSVSERPRPLHVHACEQRQELEICREEHGLLPLPLLQKCGALTASTAVVHATHLADDDIQLLAQSKANVVVCPSTERNLGDGLCRTSDLAAANISLSVGSDSHARIDVVDELRSLEDHERLRTERRCVLTPAGRSFAHGVLPAATTQGAHAIGLEAPAFAEGARADFVAIAVPLEGRGATVGAGDDDDDAAQRVRQQAVDAWLVGGSGRDVTDVFIAGERALADRQLTQASMAEIESAALAVLRR